MTYIATPQSLSTIPEEGGGMNERVSGKRLEELGKELSDRDLGILRTLRMLRCCTTHHLRRLHFTGATSELTALRATNRVLNKLNGYSLVSRLKRRIGGVRAGSGAYVWRLAPAGHRLLALTEKREGAPPRKRDYEPSRAFLEHTLAVTETVVRLEELTASGGLLLSAITSEPECWRKYSGSGGEAKTLRPDLFAVTVSGEYEDSWFFEIDLATEAPSTVLRKCAQYILYYKTGTEQNKYGVFPYIVWIVPDEKRRTAIAERIRKELPPVDAALFIVILMDELETLLYGGAEKFNNKRNDQ